MRTFCNTTPTPTTRRRSPRLQQLDRRARVEYNDGAVRARSPSPKEPRCREGDRSGVRPPHIVREDGPGARGPSAEEYPPITTPASSRPPWLASGTRAWAIKTSHDRIRPAPSCMQQSRLQAHCQELTRVFERLRHEARHGRGRGRVASQLLRYGGTTTGRRCVRRCHVTARRRSKCEHVRPARSREAPTGHAPLGSER